MTLSMGVSSVVINLNDRTRGILKVMQGYGYEEDDLNHRTRGILKVMQGYGYED